MFDYDVFLSFSSKEEDLVRPIWRELSLSGLRVFWSDETLKNNAGQSFFRIIEKALIKSQHFILVCTEVSLSSKWVQLEYETFFSNFHINNDEQRRLIIFLQNNFDISNLPVFLRNLQISNDIKEIIPLIGGVDLQSLSAENKKLAIQLEKANLRIKQLSSALDKYKKDDDRSSLLEKQIILIDGELAEVKGKNEKLFKSLDEANSLIKKLKLSNKGHSIDLVEQDELNINREHSIEIKTNQNGLWIEKGHGDYCESCGKRISINYGTAYKNLCKSCA